MLVRSGLLRAGFWGLSGFFLIVVFDEDFDGVVGEAGSMTLPFGPMGKRSSSTAAVESLGCHSSMAPSRVGVARSCSTGGGAVPAAAKASVDRPAERPWALNSCTRYVSKAAGPTVRAGGSVSEASDGPGGAGNRVTGMQAWAGARKRRRFGRRPP